MSIFSTRLKELRGMANLSQQELSKIIGISKSSINMYERGEREPGLETVRALADFFNVRTDYLLGKTNKNPPSESELSEGEKLWLELYNRVSDDTRDLLIKMMDSFDRIPKDKQKLALEMIRVALGNRE